MSQSENRINAEHSNNEVTEPISSSALRLAADVYESLVLIFKTWRLLSPLSTRRQFSLLRKMGWAAPVRDIMKPIKENVPYKAHAYSSGGLRH